MKIRKTPSLGIQKIAATKESCCVFKHQQVIAWSFAVNNRERHLQALCYAIASIISIEVTLFPRMT